MCEPTTLLVISVVLIAASTAMAIQADQQQRAALKKKAAFETQVALNNQTLAERAAEDARERGKVAAKQRRKDIKQLIGIQRATLAGNQVEVDFGSALDLTTDTAGVGEQEALTIENNAEREALGFITQGLNFQSSAELARLRGQVPSKAGGIALAGASKIAGSFASFGAANPTVTDASALTGPNG